MYGRPTSEYAHPPPLLQHGAFEPNDERSHTAHIYAYPPHPSTYQYYSQEQDSAYYSSPPPQAAAPQPAIYGPPLAQQSPPPVAHQRSVQPGHSPHAFADDPAFSVDPYANPMTHYPAFAMNSQEEIVPMAPNQSYSASIRSRASVRGRDISSIYGPPRPSPPSAFPTLPSPPHLQPPSLYPYPSAEGYHSRAVSDGAERSYSHNSLAPDPRMSDASSIHLAYDEPERPVIPPEPSPHSRQSFYDKIPSENPSHSPSSMSSKKKLHKSRPSPRSEGHASANTSYSSSKSSSASSFARSQSGDVSLPSKSRSSLHVVNPSPEDEENHPYAIFTPRHSYHSSTSTISSSDEPHTPPSSQGHFDHSSSYSSSKSREAKGYIDDKRLHEKKDKGADALDAAEPTVAEAPPAYTALPASTEAVAAAGPSRVASKIEYSANNVQVTLTPAGLSIDPLQPSSSHASSSSGKSSSSRRGPGSMSGDVQRPVLQANSSAPELHVPPPRDVPARPTTVPVAAPFPTSAPSSAAMGSAASAPPVAKSRSRKPSVATPPGNLDKIDELDETDPLGLGWHNSGPYDAIPKLSKSKKADAKKREDPSRGAKIFAAQAGLDPNHGAKMHPSHRTHVPVDPATTSFAVKPGQIFPPILAPQPFVHPNAAPMSPQAPFSPPQRQAYLNAHMQPSGRDEGIPPLFSPTPSEMARTREPPAKSRLSMAVPPEANLSGVGTPYATSMSEGHHSASTSGSSLSGHSASRGAIPPTQPPPLPQQYQQPPPLPQQYQQPPPPQPQQYQRSSPPQQYQPPPQQYQPPPPQQYQQPPPSHHTLHRPHTKPLQPAAPQLKPQSSRATLSRSHTVPYNNTRTPQTQTLSSDPPPTPDIALPPPSTHAPSVASSGTMPSARHVPRRLVMPTPLQPMHALPPQSQPSQASQASFGSSRSGGSGGSGLKHSASVPMRRAAADIPISKGSNVLRKTETRKEAGGATAVWAGRVVVVPEERKREKEKEKGGLGAFLFGGGAKEKEREREREREREKEKERVLAEKAREREREREREKGKKLSKARR